MDPQPQPPSPVPADPHDGPVAPGLLCRRCSYDLGGLPPSGRCPECGKPISESLRGDLLVYADAGYLARVLLGVRVVLGCILGTVCLTIASIAISIIIPATGLSVPSGVFELVSAGIGFAISVVSIYGYFLFSSPDPGVDLRDRGDRPRRILRITTLIQAVLVPVSTFGRFILPATPVVFSAGGGSPAALLSVLLVVGSIVAWAVQFFACMRYFRWLAPRIPDAQIQRQSQRYQWLLPVFFIPGSLCVGLGPLVALVLYYNLFNSLRKHLVRIGATVRAQGAGAPGTV